VPCSPSGFVGSWSSYFLGVNRSKRSLALDLKSPHGADALRRLLARSDVFIENVKPGSLEKLGFAWASVHAINPRLVHCTISGYGQTGPLRHRTGYDPIIQAESGFMDITGTADGPPVRAGVAVTDYLAGLYAFSGILLALRNRDRTGNGEHVDIALFDSMLSTLSMPAGIVQATGTTPHRVGNDHPSIAPYEGLRTRDGFVMIAAANPRLWKQLCAAVEVPHLVDDSRFLTNTDRVRNRAALKSELEGAFANYSVDDLIARLHKAAVPCGIVRTVADALGDPQVAARQMLLDFGDPEWAAYMCSVIRSSCQRTARSQTGALPDSANTPGKYSRNLATRRPKSPPSQRPRSARDSRKPRETARSPRMTARATLPVLMSALGQKQTLALQKPCPLYTQ
jgi:crotonobetainyl-CoA:carnitine CoA-transferase CaiB-like acyl-CoA transferase